MRKIIEEIVSALKCNGEMTATELAALVRRHNQNIQDSKNHHAKKRLLPYYLRVKRQDEELWSSWKIDADCEHALVKLLQMKPRRTASGVATITVITKPWICSSNCIYCPNDIRMPKSYLSDEPACQRAERNFFDPYLQASMRLAALNDMGHNTSKIELIVLGGTWNDYPEEYQLWYMSELFRALNNPATKEEIDNRRGLYENAGISSQEEDLEQRAQEIQDRINSGSATYNQAFAKYYKDDAGWNKVSEFMQGSWENLESLHTQNENANHRVVGLVIETRPDLINDETGRTMRRLGCTKVQLGIQSLNPEVLKANQRRIDIAAIEKAFRVLRLHGFKIHIHFMVNLLGSSPEMDKLDYLKLVTDDKFLPDEVKLYPCSLINGTPLMDSFACGDWKPYSEDELVDVLVCDTLATPAYTRISRMIRDISSGDIVAGNKKTNLRQMVEGKIELINAEGGAQVENSVVEVSIEAGVAVAGVEGVACGSGASGGVATSTTSKASATSTSSTSLEKITPNSLKSAKVREIRYREINTNGVDPSQFRLDKIHYNTSCTREIFMQWVDNNDRIAGFLRLSLPFEEKGAMIREVHIYGQAALIVNAKVNHLNTGSLATSRGKNQAQHMGLGSHLVTSACNIAQEAGFDQISVISAIGTREYYRKLGFHDAGLYQVRELR